MKQAVLAVSFGSSVAQARSGPIAAVESALQAAVPQLPFYRAYTSPTIRRGLAKQGIVVPSLTEALEQMASAGITHPFILPTHLLPGIEYDKIKAAAAQYAPRFAALRLGRSLLGTPEDLRELSRILMEHCPAHEGENTLFMGHGTEHFADLVYPALQAMFTMAGRSDLQVATVEGWPALEDVIPSLTACRLILRPLMLVAGDHANHDMAGDGKGSWKSAFQAAGFCPARVRGLGRTAPGAVSLRPAPAGADGQGVTTCFVAHSFLYKEKNQKKLLTRNYVSLTE